MYSTTPNLTDYQSFLQNVAGIPLTALTYSLPDPTVAPSLSEVAGGTLPQTEYFVVYCYTNVNGTTIPSPEANLTVAADNLLQVASPAALTGASNWAVYAGTVSGQETLQASGLTIGTAWTLPVGGLVTGSALPIANDTESPIIQTSLNIAIDIVNTDIQTASPDLYVLAVYNFATDRLINFAPDLPSQNYFATVRATWNLTLPSVGVAASGSDQGTSSSWLNPEQLKTLTLANLQSLKTPYGRQYLGIAQSYGTLWGIT